MKSIYQKLTLILVAGFIIEILLIGMFYRNVVLKQIVTEINLQENNRQTIMQKAVDVVQKFPNKPEDAMIGIEQLAKQYKASFELKDVDGRGILKVENDEGKSNNLKEQAYIRVSGKITYLLDGFFPARVPNLEVDLDQQRYRIVVSLIILVLAMVTLFIVYRTIAEPLKKLSKAVSNMNYGNTVIEIPYYAEDELGLLCRNFEDMGKRLKQSEDIQQELIQAVSHDIKTPLTSIIGYSKRITEGKVDEKRKNEYYETILRKANDLKAIVDELEDYATINSENKFNKHKIEAVDFFESISKELKSEVESRGGEYLSSIELNESTVIDIDKQKIKRVLLNIVENSLKYAGDGCIISLDCYSEEHFIKVKLYDNGIGVPEELLDRIFDRFYRIDSSRSRENGGTGLGLAICKDIIKKHGGDIGAEKSRLNGLSIWFTIPIYYQ